jgi:hypothetical protein
LGDAIVGNIKTVNDVTWTETQFIAVGDVTSAVRISWTTEVSPITANLQLFTWSGTQFVAIGGYGTILTSLDCETRAIQTSGTLIGFNNWLYVRSIIILAKKLLDQV